MVVFHTLAGPTELSTRPATDPAAARGRSSVRATGDEAVDGAGEEGASRPAMPTGPRPWPTATPSARGRAGTRVSSTRRASSTSGCSDGTAVPRQRSARCRRSRSDLGWTPDGHLLERVDADGSVRVVAGDLVRPCGMAISPTGLTLCVHETFAARVTVEGGTVLEHISSGTTQPTRRPSAGTTGAPSPMAPATRAPGTRAPCVASGSTSPGRAAPEPPGGSPSAGPRSRCRTGTASPVRQPVTARLRWRAIEPWAAARTTGQPLPRTVRPPSIVMVCPVT